jgi:hypothetical protein
MGPLSCRALGCRGISGTSMVFGLTSILFTIAHSRESPDWIGTGRPCACWGQIAHGMAVPMPG